MNIWMIFLFVVPAALVFCAKPETSDKWRGLRLLLATACGWVLINFSAWKVKAVRSEDYGNCRRQFSDGDVQTHTECAAYFAKLIDTPALIMLFFKAFFIASLYTLLLERIWRRMHKTRIIALGNTYGGNTCSNIALCFFYPFILSFPLLDYYIRLFNLYEYIFE